MGDLVLLPWADHATALDGATDGLEVELYDGSREPSAKSLERTAFYVPPYMSASNTVALIEAMPHLRVMQTLTAGVDNVWPHLRDGVTLCNAAGVHDASTAELTLGLILASLRGIDDYARAMTTGTWTNARRESLADKQVLVIGHGHVGQAIIARLLPFEVDVARVGSRARVLDDGTPVHGIDEVGALLPTADVVVLIVPQTFETTGLVDAQFLAQMKQGALLVNVARGPVVVTEDLLDAVRRGHVRAALDVTDPEPLPADHALWSTPGVLISPHIGGFTSAFLPRAHRVVADQLRRWASGQPLANVMTRPTTLD